MAQQVAPSTGLTPVPDHDFMPLNGIDHVELYVGNALQAAYFYAHAFGFKRVAYARPGDRHARPRLPRAPAGPHPARPHRRASLRLADRRPPAQARRRRQGHRAERPRRRPRLPRGHEPWRHAASASRARSPTSTARSRLATIETYGETLHTFVEIARLRRPVPPRLRARRGRHRGQRDAAGHRPHRRQRRARLDGDLGQVLRGRLRDDRDDPLLRRDDLDRVLGADVEGRHRRQGPS